VIGAERPDDSGARTRVLIVDEHRSYADALGVAVESRADMRFVGAAVTAAEVADLVVRKAPDVVVMDLSLPGGDPADGPGRVRRLRPETRVVVLTAHPDSESMARAAAEGVSVFLSKATPVSVVLDAVRSCSTEHMVVGERTLSEFRGSLTQRAGKLANSSSPELTVRELEVIALMARGCDAARIGAQLGIRLSTCRWHIRGILRKLGAHSQLEAVLIAVRLGLVPPPEREA